MTFTSHQAILHAESVSLVNIAAQYGTPTYVYSEAALRRNWDAFQIESTVPYRVCYAVKANSNLQVLRHFAELGSGFDIVSVGELEAVLAAGGKPEHIVFSGVGKQSHEIVRALEVGIGCFNVESPHELLMIEQLASAQGVVAAVAMRINPNIDAGSHPYISTGLRENKFGLTPEVALPLYHQAAASAWLDPIGIACHIGSQIHTCEPFVAALKQLVELAQTLRHQGIVLSHIDAGGGIGVAYREDERAISPATYLQALTRTLEGFEYELWCEPGRSLVANAGILLTRVITCKTQGEKHFAIVDAGMNDLLRPSLYQAWHDIVPVESRPENPMTYDVVGPVCETGDFLGLERTLTVEPGDLLAITHAGAYGFVMSSNYNNRPRAAEVWVSGETHFCAREREILFPGNEIILPQ